MRKLPENVPPSCIISTLGSINPQQRQKQSQGLLLLTCTVDAMIRHHLIEHCVAYAPQQKKIYFALLLGKRQPSAEHYPDATISLLGDCLPRLCGLGLYARY